MSEKNFNTFQENINDEIDIANLMRYILMQSKMIFLIVFTAFLLSIAWYISSTKIYKISSLLQVESFNTNALDPTDTFQMMSPLNSSADIDNLTVLYKSRTNILKIIKGQDLNIQIEDVYDHETIDIKFTHKENDSEYEQIFYILPKKDLLKVFSEDGKNLLVDAKYGQEINVFNEFTFSVQSSTLDSERLIKITYTNPLSLYQKYKRAIKLKSYVSQNSFIRDKGLIEISIDSDDINKAKNIINYANKIFLDQRLSAETEKSRAAIKFIDENLLGLEKVVNQNKERLKKFRETNGSVNLDLETQIIIEKVKTLDEALDAINLELADLSEIYTNTNPVYINLTNKKNILTNQKNQILSDIKKMPKEQQEYIDLFSQVEITQNLFEELQARKLGFSILEASTIGDIRVIDSAYVEDMISPTFSSVILFNFMSIFIAILIALIRGAKFLPITNPAEIIDNGIFEPILGVFPYDDDISNINVNTEGRYKSSLESTIVNLNTISDSKNDFGQIIALTSPTPLNGKSTSSKSLAQGLSLLGKKVLLIDGDFKRGGLGSDFNVKSISEETFFNINSSNLDNYRLSNTLYLIPRIRGLSNSFQFVHSQRFPKIIEFFRSEFDYIIIDTAPVLSVADTSLIIKQADINIMIIRHEYNKIAEIKQAIDMFRQINVTLNGFIYNAYSKPKGYYGYYSLYGNYAYSYYSHKYLKDTYEYTKDS
jgi:tyrosine-protein kinase Etk/Wzc